MKPGGLFIAGSLVAIGLAYALNRVRAEQPEEDYGDDLSDPYGVGFQTHFTLGSANYERLLRSIGQLDSGTPAASLAAIPNPRSEGPFTGGVVNSLSVDDCGAVTSSGSAAPFYFYGISEVPCACGCEDIYSRPDFDCSLHGGPYGDE